MTPRPNEHAGDHGSPSATTPRPRGRRSLAFGAAVLIGAAVVGGASGAGAAGLLTGKNVRDDSLRSADFRDGSIGAAKIHDGSLAPKDVSFDLTGDQGVRGVDGLRGLAGIQAIRLRTGMPRSSDLTEALLLIANCGPGEMALSGGAQLDVADPGVLPYILQSASVAGVTWNTLVSSPGGGNVQYTPWVVCAQVS